MSACFQLPLPACEGMQLCCRAGWFSCATAVLQVVRQLTANVDALSSRLKWCAG